MSLKVHSTMSRRDFMKALGLTAAGVAAVGAASPVVHDLDELLQEGENGKFAVQKHPWWVKKRKLFDITVDVDWNATQRYNRVFESQTTFTMTRYVDPATRTQWSNNGTENSRRLRQNAGPGWNVKWRALSEGKGSSSYTTGWTTNYSSHVTAGNCEPIALTDAPPPWPKGNAEDNAKLLNAAMRFFGATWVGYQPLSGKWQEKMIVEATTAGATGTWSDTYKEVPVSAQTRFTFDNTVDRPRVETTNGTRYVIPTKEPQHIIVYSTPASSELMKGVESSNHTPNSTTNGNWHTDIAARTNGFLRALGCGSFAYGYVGHQSSETNYSQAMIYAGLAEHSRQNLYSITPEVGTAHNPANIMTNFPLQPTTPIDSGIWKMCQACGKCAETCPSKSIMTKKEKMDWEPPKRKRRLDNVEENWTWTPGGRKVYYMDFISCNQYRSEKGACSYCYSNCVFNEDRAAMIHNIVRSTVAHTSLFNSFFGSSIAESFGFGSYENADIWWDMYLPALGMDTTIGAGKGYR